MKRIFGVLLSMVMILSLFTSMIVVNADSPTPVESVSLDSTSLRLTVGDNATLTATVLPATADNKNVTWTSDNIAVATVDANGKVTAKAAGTAKITVTTAEGGKTATCTVTVTDSITVTTSFDYGTTKNSATAVTVSSKGTYGQYYSISLDLAMDKASCEIKKYDSPVSGNTDILLVPYMAVGNIFVKGLLLYAGARMVGVVTGAKCPIALNSRSASFEEKYYSLMACAAICK